jgi:L-rhamnose mutarotase
MERFAWKAIILPGMLEEYKRRHGQIWPEMTALLNEAGIHNYTIWNVGDELFGYYECESIEKASRVQTQSDVVKRWNESMKPLMRMVADGREGEGGMVNVFYHP